MAPLSGQQTPADLRGCCDLIKEARDLGCLSLAAGTQSNIPACSAGAPGLRMWLPSKGRAAAIGSAVRSRPN
jgi:hypothetical protein